LIIFCFGLIADVINTIGSYGRRKFRQNMMRIEANKNGIKLTVSLLLYRAK
jgi:hypothetical protein